MNLPVSALLNNTQGDANGLFCIVDKAFQLLRILYVHVITITCEIKILAYDYYKIFFSQQREEREQCNLKEN
jgi:hypothetical protein